MFDPPSPLPDAPGLRVIACIQRGWGHPVVGEGGRERERVPKVVERVILFKYKYAVSIFPIFLTERQ